MGLPSAVHVHSTFIIHTEAASLKLLLDEDDNMGIPADSIFLLDGLKSGKRVKKSATFQPKIPGQKFVTKKLHF